MKRKYIRVCGCCGERFNQADMVRTNEYETGWVCEECYAAAHPEYEIEDW